MKERFSDRFGYSVPDSPITVWDDAPRALREALTMIAREANLSPSQQREIVCRVLLKRPNYEGNWGEYPNIWGEVNDLVATCRWWNVYDIAEALFDALPANEIDSYLTVDAQNGSPREFFVRKLNGVLLGEGIGWKITAQGVIELRSDQYAGHAVEKAREALQVRNMPKSLRELQMALEDLSRRPDPDVTGVVQHGTAALESLVREVTGTTKTLGQAAKELEHLAVHPALREAISRLFGYASDYQGGGRHGSEEVQVSRTEAQLLFHVCAALIAYLSEKAANRGQ